MDEPSPDLCAALEDLLQALPARVPQLAHVDARRLLIVAGQARGAARASIRSLAPPGSKLEITWQGSRRLYEITLRPAWFRCSGPRRRLRALLHELWHIGPGCDGALLPRGEPDGDRDLARAQLRHLLLEVERALPRQDLEILGHHGEVRVLAWLRRPVLPEDAAGSRVFGNESLYIRTEPMLGRARPGARADGKLTGAQAQRTVGHNIGDGNTVEP